MAQVLDGNEIARELRQKTKAQIDSIQETNPEFRPHLQFLQVGINESGSVYIRETIEAANEVGISADCTSLPRTSTENEVLAAVENLNANRNIDAILITMPLDSEHEIDSQKVFNTIAAGKDVEGMRLERTGELAFGTPNDMEIVQCTGRAILEMIKRTDYGKNHLEGVSVVVIGRDQIGGLPSALLLLRENSIVTIVDPDLSNAAQTVKERGDIVAATAGGSKRITADWIKKGAVVIDSAFYINPDGSKTGNVDFESVKPVASWITPVPGGIGPVTVAMLLDNTVRCAKQRQDAQ